MVTGVRVVVVDLVVVVVVVIVVVVVMAAVVGMILHMDPDDPLNISFVLTLKFAHASPQRVCVNDVAPANICFMLVALDTSHLETSLLKEVA